MSHPAYAQNNDDFVYASKQKTLSENLENDSVAQDILEKIEKTKKWIRGIEEIKTKQKEVDEKRTETLAILQKDLKAWQKLWEEFTFEYQFEQKTGIFWSQYNFTNSKILAGRAALEDALAQGAGPEEARNAYADAAKIKRSELIMTNSLINVKHGFAYYNQQILFDSDGQFHDIVSGDKLQKYYQDFRTSPAYLNSNPKDETSWEDLSVGINSECRSGYVLLHRYQTDDYACVTEQTSEMWTRHNMGKPMIDYVIQPANDKLSINKFKEDTIREKIRNINDKLNSTYMYYGQKVQDVEKKYQAKIDDLHLLQLEEERILVSKIGNSKDTQDHLLQEIEKTRDHYESLEQMINKENLHVLDIMKTNHDQRMRELVSEFEFISDIQIIWDSNESKYKAVRK